MPLRGASFFVATLHFEIMRWIEPRRELLPAQRSGGSRGFRAYLGERVETGLLPQIAQHSAAIDPATAIAWGSAPARGRGQG